MMGASISSGRACQLDMQAGCAVTGPIDAHHRSYAAWAGTSGILLNILAQFGRNRTSFRVTASAPRGPKWCTGDAAGGVQTPRGIRIMRARVDPCCAESRYALSV